MEEPHDPGEVEVERPEQLLGALGGRPEGSERGSVLRMIRDAPTPGGTVAIKEFDSAMSGTPTSPASISSRSTS